MPTQLENNLVGYWKLDGNSTNAVGNTGLNGTDTAVTYGSGKVGSCATFDGTNTAQGIVIPGTDTFKEVYTTGVFTISFWIKPVDRTVVQYIMGNASGVSGTKGFYLGFNMNAAGTGGISFIMYNGGVTNLTDNNTLLDNNWTHIAYVGDGNFVRLYKNGLHRSTSPAFTAQSTTTAPAALRVGGNAGLTATPFAGSIDEFAYWSRTLSAHEIAAIYNMGVGLTYPLDNTDRVLVQNDYNLESGLIGYWPLNGNALDVYDRNNGVVSGSFPAGKIGTGFKPTATSSRVTIPHSISMSPSTAISLSIWIKPETNTDRFYVFKESSGASADYYLAGNSSRFVIRTMGGVGIVQALSTYTLNTWYHIVFTWVSGSSLKFYINGVLQGTDNSPGTIVNTTTDLDIGNTSIGTWSSTTGANGVFDELGIWSKELTQTEVTKLYNAGLGLAWPFVRSIASRQNSSKVLDTFSGSFAGYSLKKLRTLHFGYAARIRRDLDNSETDIGFTGDGKYNISAHEEFVGNTLRNDARHYLKFENNIGDSIGTMSNSANVISYTTGKQGNCAVFNGTTSYIALPSLALADESTLSFWFYPVTTGKALLSNAPSAMTYADFDAGIKSGLMSYYTLNSSAADSHSTNHGSAFNMTYTAGRSDDAGVFNGTTGYISAPPINPVTGLTVSCWATIDQFFGDSAGHALVSNSNFAADGYMIYQSTDFPHNRLKVFIITSSGMGLLYSPTLSTGTWYHIVLTYDGANAKLYVDNVEAHSIPLTGNVLSSAAPFLIGNTYTGTSLHKGNIDEVGVWNRALTISEIEDLYLSGDLRSYVHLVDQTTIEVKGEVDAPTSFTVPTMSLNSWHHLVLTRDSDSVRLFVDNVESSTGTASIDDEFIFDRMGSPGGGADAGMFFEGRIDEFGVWDRVLTSTERSIIYNSGNGMTMPFAGKGYVKTLYDQDRNGINVSQTDNTLQPYVFVGDGEPVLAFTQSSHNSFLGSTDSLIGTTFTGNRKPGTIFIQFRPNDTSVPFNGAFIINNSSTSTPYLFGVGSSTTGSNTRFSERADSAASVALGYTVDTAYSVYTGIFGAVNISGWKDSVSVGTSVARTNATTTVNRIAVGGGWPSNSLDGKLSQAILYASDKTSTRTSIESMISETPLLNTNGLIIHLDSSSANSFPGGDTWTDLSVGTANNATLANRPMLLNVDGGVIDFNGTNQYGTINYSGIITGARTYSVWIKYDTVTGLHNGFSLTGVQQLNAYNYVGVKNGGKYYFYIGATGTDGVNNGDVTSVTLLPDVWYNQCVVLNSDGSRSAYLDGAEIFSGTGGVGNSATADFAIGSVNDGVNGRQHWVDGKIGQILQYNRALTSDEVASNYNATRTRFGKPEYAPYVAPSAPSAPSFPTTNLVAYYKFDGNVLDSFGSRHGTHATGAIVSYTTGQDGQGITYSSGNLNRNYTTYPALGLTGASPWTFSCWVKVASGQPNFEISGFGQEAFAMAAWFYIRSGTGTLWADWYSSGPLKGGSVVVANNTWRHVAVKYTGTQLSLYVDGLQDGTPLTTSINLGNSYFWTGKVYSGSAPGNGSIDEFAVFNAALSDADILAIANGAVYP